MKSKLTFLAGAALIVGGLAAILVFDGRWGHRVEYVSYPTICFGVLLAVPRCRPVKRKAG